MVNDMDHWHVISLISFLLEHGSYANGSPRILSTYGLLPPSSPNHEPAILSASFCTNGTPLLANDSISCSAYSWKQPVRRPGINNERAQSTFDHTIDGQKNRSIFTNQHLMPLLQEPFKITPPAISSTSTMRLIFQTIPATPLAFTTLQQQGIAVGG